MRKKTDLIPIKECVELAIKRQAEIWRDQNRSAETRFKAGIAVLILQAVHQALLGYPMGLEEFARDGFWQEAPTKFNLEYEFCAICGRHYDPNDDDAEDWHDDAYLTQRYCPQCVKEKESQEGRI